MNFVNALQIASPHQLVHSDLVFLADSLERQKMSLCGSQYQPLLIFCIPKYL